MQRNMEFISAHSQNLFMSNAPGKVIGITGTKGKSTTASLIAAFLSTKYSDVRLVGNIGTPALDALAGANKSTFFVAEFSSFQLEDLRISPHTAVLLDIFPEHLDHHSDFESYVSAKLNILRSQRDGDLVFAAKAVEKFIKQDDAAFKGHYCRIEETEVDSQILEKSNLPLAVSANRKNLRAAAAAALILLRGSCPNFRGIEKLPSSARSPREDLRS